MENCKNFTQINKNSTNIAGGKGASLGEMIGANIPVPPGFVILAQNFDSFIHETSIKADIISTLDKVNHKDVASIDHASKQIQSMILSKDMPEDLTKEIQTKFQELNSKFVAVRSSATSEDSADAAWAGQLDTFLNTTKENLILNIKKCWASLFTPRAIFYRFEKNLQKEQISVAVVVQKMVESEISGVAFSVHPVTQDRNQLIIEAGIGLGESIVSGQITPDSYVVQKDDLTLLDISISEQKRAIVKGPDGGTVWKELGEEGEDQKLSGKQIIELSKMIINIEKHYGFPCDIEWAVENKVIYITQSRPITTLSNNEPVKKKRLIKTITREIPLISVESYYNGMVNKTKEFFGFKLSENLFLFKNGTSQIYRENESFHNDCPKKISNWLKNNENLLQESFKGLQDSLEISKKIKNSDISDPIKAIDLLEKLNNTFKRGCIGLITTYWIPVWQEKYKKKSSINLFKESTIEKLKETRNQTESFFDESIESMFILLNKIADIKNWDKKLLKYITFDELKQSLSENKLFSIESLENRKNNTFAYISKKIVPENKLNKFLNEKNLFIYEEKIESTDTIKGTTANKGKIKGIAKIILNREQLNKIQVSEILIAPMTTPFYLPAMKKAAAFVTDEGGVTCHAAIISREMNKPCIIGTKHATSLIKDGDLLEVDANNGIVRILKGS